MTESIYKEYQNKYYNPNDNDKKPGDNDNWKSIQKGFHDISTTQLETSVGLTLGKGTADETSLTAAELEALKKAMLRNPVLAGGFNIAPSQAINPYSAVTYEYSLTNLEMLKQWMRDSKAVGFYIVAPAVRQAVNENTMKLEYVPMFTIGTGHIYALIPEQIDNLTGFAVNVLNRTSETVSGGYSSGSPVYIVAAYGLEGEG